MNHIYAAPFTCFFSFSDVSNPEKTESKEVIEEEGASESKYGNGEMQTALKNFPFNKHKELTIQVETSSITKARLHQLFGEGYFEGKSKPRKFGIYLNHCVGESKNFQGKDLSFCMQGYLYDLNESINQLMSQLIDLPINM